MIYQKDFDICTRAAKVARSIMMVDKEATEEGCGSRRALIVVCSTDHKRLALITPVVCSTVRGTTCRLQARVHLCPTWGRRVAFLHCLPWFLGIDSTKR